jgi:hypothetical protein
MGGIPDRPVTAVPTEAVETASTAITTDTLNTG